ncbi:cation transporter [Nocardia ninae]
MRFRWAVIALVGIVVCSCSRGTEESRGIEAALDRMPGVHQVSTDFDTNFSTVVVLAGDASAEQTKAVIEVFRDRIAAASGLQRRRIDIEIRWGEQPSSFKAGRDGLAAAPDRAVQWHTLSHAFPEDEVAWTYKWDSYCCDDFGPGDLIAKGHNGIGHISLKPLDANDFRAVSETYRRLIREFPELAGAEWEVGAWGRKSGFLRMDNRYPSELEFSVWQRLNEDQTLPHSVHMVTRSEPRSYPTRPHVSEQLQSSNFDDAKLLAEKHLPIVAELGPAAVDYLATSRDSLASSDPDRSLRITIGDCQYRDRPPSPAEQPLVERYGKC